MPARAFVLLAIVLGDAGMMYSSVSVRAFMAVAATATNVFVWVSDRNSFLSLPLLALMHSSRKLVVSGPINARKSTCFTMNICLAMASESMSSLLS